MIYVNIGNSQQPTGVLRSTPPLDGPRRQKPRTEHGGGGKLGLITRTECGSTRLLVCLSVSSYSKSDQGIRHREFRT